MEPRPVTRALAVAAGVLTAALLALPSTAGAAPRTAPASAANASAATVSAHPATTPLAGTVNVSSLPRASAHATGAMRQIPLRSRPGGAAPGPAEQVRPAGGTSPLLSISAGTQLTPALQSSDNITGLTPPDMAVGADATHVMQMVNVVGKIWTNGTPGSAFQLSSFFLGGSNFLSDPWTLYDQESGRWFAGIFDVTLGGERIAVSQTGDPTGSWFVYSVQYPGEPNGGCPDQGKGGVDSDVVSLGFNEFSGNGCTGGFLGAAVEVFNKSQMLSGSSVNFVYTTPQPNWFSMVPAQALSNGMTTQYFAANTGLNRGTALQRVTSVGAPCSTGCTTITNLSNLTVKAYNNPPAAAQPGTSSKLDSGDVRMQHVVQKVVNGNTELLMTWTDRCRPAGDTAARACSRVTETNETSPSVIFSKDIATVGAYDIYPAATLNSANDAVVTFGQSSSTIKPQLMATAAKPGRPAFLTPILLAAGTSANTTGRYGDYFAVALDPGGTTPNQNVWAAGEIGGPNTGAWNTAVREVNVTP